MIEIAAAKSEGRRVLLSGLLSFVALGVAGLYGGSSDVWAEEQSVRPGINSYYMDPDWQQWDEFLGISAGIFHMINLGLNRSLSFRLEGALRPGADWEEIPGGADYALVLFPEVAFSPSDTVSLQLRSLISPVDLSALNLFSVSWNIYQGLTIFSYLSLPVGDGNDLYRWDQDLLTAWTAGLEFVY